MRRPAALVAARLAFEAAFPLPRGFMPLWIPIGGGIPVPSIPCVADEFVEDAGVFSFEPFNDGRPMLVGHPRAWTSNGARNLAAAYRPEGLP